MSFPSSCFHWGNPPHKKHNNAAKKGGSKEWKTKITLKSVDKTSVPDEGWGHLEYYRWRIQRNELETSTSMDGLKESTGDVGDEDGHPTKIGGRKWKPIQEEFAETEPEPREGKGNFSGGAVQKENSRPGNHWRKSLKKAVRGKLFLGKRTFGGSKGGSGDAKETRGDYKKGEG